MTQRNVFLDAPLDPFPQGVSNVAIERGAIPGLGDEQRASPICLLCVFSVTATNCSRTPIQGHRGNSKTQREAAVFFLRFLCTTQGKGSWSANSDDSWTMERQVQAVWQPRLRTFWKNVVCEHLSMAERWILLNLLQLEMKRLNCSPTAPSTTMPEARQARHGSGAIWEASEHGSQGSSPTGRGLRGLRRGPRLLGFGLFKSSPLCRPAPPSRAPQATAREVVYGTVDTLLRFQTRREHILSRLKQLLSYSKGLEQTALRRQRWISRSRERSTSHFKPIPSTT